MSEKKKNQQSTNTLAFIAFWVLVVGISQLQLQDYSELWRVAYDTVMKLPQGLHRMWIAYLLHGLIAGATIGLSQKFALQSLRPMQLKYWVPATVFVAVIAKIIDYSMMRWVYSLGLAPFPPEFYSITPYFGQALMLLVPWWFLRKEFKQSWLWLLLLIPNLTLASMYSLYPYIPYLQALLGACVLLWLNHHNPMFGKSKTASEADARLLDMLPEAEDEDEAESPMVRYQRKA